MAEVRASDCNSYVSKDQSEPINRDPINWVQRGAVTQVINEGNCNSDWAVATVGAIEGAYYVFSGTEKDLRRLSPQQLVDCATTEDNCWGGAVEGAIYYSLNHLIEEYDDYPYTQASGEACNYNEDLGSVRVDGCSLLPIDQPWDIVDALYTSPVAIQLEADTWNFQHYKSGIFRDTNCGTTLNHAVLVVGWGV